MSPLYILLLVPAIFVEPSDQISGKLPLTLGAYDKTGGTNGDGEVDFQEFGDGKQTVIAQNRQFFNYFDKNHDKGLDIKEIEGFFREADSNKDGYITRLEIANHFSLVVEALEKAINAAS